MQESDVIDKLILKLGGLIILDYLLMYCDREKNNVASTHEARTKTV